jgi:hypothetical protein
MSAIPDLDIARERAFFNLLADAAREAILPHFRVGTPTENKGAGASLIPSPRPIAAPNGPSAP